MSGLADSIENLSLGEAAEFLREMRDRGFLLTISLGSLPTKQERLEQDKVQITVEDQETKED